jgi:hypothetical protein
MSGMALAAVIAFMVVTIAVASMAWSKSREPVTRGFVLALSSLIVVVCLYLVFGPTGRLNATFAGHPKQAFELCVSLEQDLQRSSSNWAIVSWIAALAASLFSAVGGLVGSGRSDGAPSPPWYRAGAGVLLATVGSTLAATAAFSVARSNAASAAAAAATLALSEPTEREMYRRCVAAKAQWLQTRADSLDQNPPPTPKGGQRSLDVGPPAASSSAGGSPP